MFQINRLRALLALLTILALAPAAAHAQAEAGRSGKPVWEVDLRKELPEHDPPFYRAFITAGTNKFALLLPLGYFLQGKEDGILRLATSEGGSQITFAVRPSSDPHYTDNDAFRDYVLAAHPGAKITSEVATGVGRWTGHGFDLSWRSTSGNTLGGRAIFALFDGGVLEFTGSTNPANLPLVQTAMDRFQRSLIVAKDGKLAVPHLSGTL